MGQELLCWWRERLARSQKGEGRRGAPAWPALFAALVLGVVASLAVAQPGNTQTAAPTETTETTDTTDTTDTTETTETTDTTDTTETTETSATYVALGDSFTAGPVIPVQIPPFGCLKSNNNYPHQVAGKLGLDLGSEVEDPEFRDASCSGAKTDDMTRSQDVDPNPDPRPQFRWLGAATKLVTIGIGGNDIGFSEIARNCSSTTNSGTPCRDRYVVRGRDEISARIKEAAPKVAAVLEGIHTESPSARVYVVNYLPILPDKGTGCHPQVPVTDGDVPYLRAKQKELNGMLATQAAANNATLVDAYTVGIGHDACKLPNVRYVEPAAPVLAAPLHPNLAGMTATANAVKAKVGSIP